MDDDTPPSPPRRGLINFSDLTVPEEEEVLGLDPLTAARPHQWMDSSALTFTPTQTVKKRMENGLIVEERVLARAVCNQPPIIQLNDTPCPSPGTPKPEPVGPPHLPVFAIEASPSPIA